MTVSEDPSPARAAPQEEELSLREEPPSSARRDASWFAGTRLLVLLLVGGATLALLMVVFNRLRAPAPPPSQVVVNSAGTPGTREAPTQEYARGIEQGNAERAARARAEGRANVPDPAPVGAPGSTAPRADALAQPAAAGSNAVGAASLAPMSPSLAYSTPVVAAPVAAPAEPALDVQRLERLISSWSPATATEGSIAKTIEVKPRAVPVGTAASSVAGPAAATDLPGLATARGQAFFAVLDKRVETDLSPLVIASLVSGPYAGAQVRGKATRAYDNVRIEFNDMLWRGQRYPIAALGVDERTTTDLIEGRVDRRAMSRYVLPLLLGGAATAAAVMSQPQTRTTVLGGAAVVETPPATDRQIAAGAVQGGIAAVKDAFTADVPPKTVVLESGASIGVYFF
jgi:hypothetical protein